MCVLAILRWHTYQLRRTTTSCWCGWRGMDAREYGCGIDPYRSAWPGICCSKYVRLPGLPSSIVHTRRTPNARRVENLPRWPSCDPNRRYGSWGLGHHDRTVTSGTACFYSNGSWKQNKKMYRLIWFEINSIAFAQCLFVGSIQSAG